MTSTPIPVTDPVAASFTATYGEEAVKQVRYHEIENKVLVRAFRNDMSRYNRGPFGIPGNLAIKGALEKARLAYVSAPDEPYAIAIYNVMQRPSVHTDLRYRDLTIGKGHLFIDAIAGARIFEPREGEASPGAYGSVLTALVNTLEGAAQPPFTWVQAHEEHPHLRRWLTDQGFTWAGTKVDAYSTLKGLYFRPYSVRNTNWTAPMAPFTGAWDEATLTRCVGAFLLPEQHADLLDELKRYEPVWADHYSTYNVKDKEGHGTWSAFALQGFQPDPNVIVKPSEMPKDWIKEHPTAIKEWELQRTSAAEHFPKMLKVVTDFCQAYSTHAQRIRVMRLSASGGELARHSDITDRGAGTKDGQVCRFHVPLVTNPGVLFSVWDERGGKMTRHMNVGELWYLDQRKPHQAINEDPTQERVHLVFDVFANEALREEIEGMHIREKLIGDLPLLPVV